MKNDQELIPLTRRQARAIAKMLNAYADGGTPQYKFANGWRDAEILIRRRGVIGRYRVKSQ